MGQQVICDTGVVSRAILGFEPYSSAIKNEIGADNAFITPIILMELFNWLSGYHQLAKAKRALAMSFISALPMFHITEDISHLAVLLAKDNINAKPADTLIAATALHYKIPVYTLNKKDFQQLGAAMYK